MDPRSLLFVPANRSRYLEPAARSGTDAIILDLEDSVPEAEKASARAALTGQVATLRSLRSDLQVYVRPNPWPDPHAAHDLSACVDAGVDVIYLPKVLGPPDVTRTAAHLDLLEALRNDDGPRTTIAVALETAASLARCEDIAICSDRVSGLVGASARGADVSRSVGFRWTDEGLETLFLRSRTVIAARAGGVSPIGGLWQDVTDLTGLRTFSEGNRRLGFAGQIVIHPSHVAVVNEVFALDGEEVAYYEGLVTAYDRAAAEGAGAVRYEGEMVDLAHVVTARELLAEHAERSGRGVA